MKVLKGYRFRMYPNEEQRRFFIETFGCVRFTYNHLLVEKKEKKGSYQTPAQLKKDYPFLKKTDSLALSNAQRNLERGFRNYFNGRAGYPKLKSKKRIWQSYTTNNQKNTIYVIDGQVKLPKIKEFVVIDQHRPVRGEIRSATVSAKNNEIFYLSLLCLEEVPPLKKTGEKVQLTFDETQLVSSVPSFTFPDFCQKHLNQKIKKEEKKLALRKQVAKKRQVHLSEAKNYQKQKKKVAQLEQRKANQKRDYLDQLSYLFVQKFDEIDVVKGMNQAEVPQATFQGADWQQFLNKLQYKTTWYQKKLKST
ncbi:RNA-guided endonuclease TnpB family protein [Enterococcus sp. LJL98]